MGKSQQTFNKKEREKKRRKKKQDKLEKREQRKLEKEKGGKLSFEDQLTYVDEYGNFTSTPPDPTKKKKIKADEIVLGVPTEEKVPYDPIRKGKVKFFDHEKNFGFIIDLETQGSIFVHINDADGPLQENDKVSFEIERGPKGLKAVRVKIS